MVFFCVWLAPQNDDEKRQKDEVEAVQSGIQLEKRISRQCTIKHVHISMWMKKRDTLCTAHRKLMLEKSVSCLICWCAMCLLVCNSNLHFMLFKIDAELHQNTSCVLPFWALSFKLSTNLNLIYTKTCTYIRPMMSIDLRVLCWYTLTQTDTHSSDKYGRPSQHYR